MSLLRNRHFITALLVAPLLAVLAWFAVGQWVEEPALQPTPAQSGNSYPMIERPGCRYAGGDCGLSNEDFKLALAVTPDGQLRLASAVALDYVLVGLVSSTGQPPSQAQPVSAQRDRWVHSFSAVPSSDDRLRVVAGVDGASWFGEASLIFTAPNDQ